MKQQKINTLTATETANRIGVCKTTINNLIARGELEKVQQSPILISKPSVVRYLARNQELLSIDGVIGVVETHLGNIRKLLKHDAYLVVDFKNAIGLTNSYSIVERVSSNNVKVLKFAECRANGLRPLAKGYSLITFLGIKEYLKVTLAKVDKDLFIKELLGKEIHKQIRLDEVPPKAELQVLDQREVLGKTLKIYGTSDKPLFLAKDVAEMIDYDKSSINKMLNTVSEEEKARNNVPTLGGIQNTWFLTEEGLYEVLFQSRKPIAKEFKDKVKEILKTIRTTGGYVAQEEKFVDNYFNSLPEDTKKIIVGSICEKNRQLLQLKDEKIAEMKAIEAEIEANKGVIENIK